MNLIWIWLIMFLAAVLEVVAGNLGLFVPLAALAGFYLLVTFGWRSALTPILAAVMIVDATYGRNYFIGIPLTLYLTLLSLLWRRRGNCQTIPVQALPGIAVGLAWAGAVLFCESFLMEHFFWGLTRHNLWLLLQAVLGSLILLPLLCRGLDSLAHACGFWQYQAYQQTRGGRRHG